MLLGEVWAARSSSGLTSVGLDSTGSPAPLKSLSAATFTLPRELGVIQESTEVPNSGRTVIHIQDAHCNYAAQKSIANILNYLTTEYGIYAVNCEGGAENYDLSPFTDIPEKDIREKTADFFVKEGVVSAAEYYAVNNPRKVNLWGVEDPDLYIKNLKIYRDSLAHKAEVDRYIKSIGYALNNLKRHIYSDELLELDKHYTGYKEGKITFKEYMLYLINIAQKRMINIKPFSNIYLLSQTLEEEDRINFKRANNERDEVVDKLKKVISKAELEELVSKVAQLKSESISQSDFYAYLIRKAKSIKLDLVPYPDLKKYIVYISLYSAIDKTEVAKEVDELEDKIKESLYENDTQRELGVLSKNLAITKNIFNISLTKDDYTYYKEHRETFAVASYISFIDSKAPLYKISVKLDKNIGSLDNYRNNMDQFYQISLERDKAFIKNIKFTDHDRPNSIIITGGFHTENLRELFKNEKISYISIMPKFKNEKGYESPYMKRLAGQRTALENVIDTAIPAILNLQVVEILSKLGLVVEGRSNIEHFRLAIQIVAAINRGQDFIMQVSKGFVLNSRPLDEDKAIVFTRGPGEEIVSRTGPLDPSAKVNAKLISLEPFEYEPVMPEAKIVTETEAAPAPAPVTPAAPVVTPFEKAKAIAEPMYDAAKKIVPEISGIMRRGSPTYLITPAMAEDIAPTTSNNRTAEQLLGKQGHKITAKSYPIDEKWEEKLETLLLLTMPSFETDLSNSETRGVTRMAIRFMPDAEGKIAQGIRDAIRKFLSEKGYDKDQIEEILDKNIHLIPISIQHVEHLNSSIDLFTDLGMMEIDRYLRGAYPGEELPAVLRDRFLALLKLSITNFDDFMKIVKTEEDIEGILEAIFKLNTLLRIKPVDWKSIDDWKKENNAVLQSA